MERAHLGRLEAPRLPERVDAGTPERLVGIDVPDAGERSLVEDRRLDRSLPGREPLTQHLRGEAGLQRLWADTRIEVGVELAGLEQQPRAEAADITVGDVRSVV